MPKSAKIWREKIVLQQTAQINIKEYLVFGRKYLAFEIVYLVNLILEWCIWYFHLTNGA